jgi:hypothetical protein
LNLLKRREFTILGEIIVGDGDLVQTTGSQEVDPNWRFFAGDQGSHT